MKKWIKRLSLFVLVVLLACAGLAGYVWRVYLDSGLAREEVSIPSGEESLAGRLWLPDGPGPFPAVVILHGSSPSTRDQPALVMHANAFAKRGIAALVYDKHGFGESSGVHVRRDYRVFIADVHAALDYLKSRADIVPDSLGLAGNSESGWFLPQIALERDDIRFAYSRAGPAVSYIEVSAYQHREELRQSSGLEPEQIDEIIQLLIDRFQFYVDAAGDEALYRAQRAVIQERVDQCFQEYDPRHLPFSRNLLEWNEEVVERVAHCHAYDAEAYLRQNSGVPFLYVFGELDVNVPTEASVRILEDVRAATGQDISIHVYPGDDHTMNRMTRLLTGSYPADYFDRMLDFALGALEEEG